MANPAEAVQIWSGKNRIERLRHEYTRKGGGGGRGVPGASACSPRNFASLKCTFCVFSEIISEKMNPNLQ